MARIVHVVALACVCLVLAIHLYYGDSDSQVDRYIAKGAEVGFIIILIGLILESPDRRLEVYFQLVGTVIFAVYGGILLYNAIHGYRGEMIGWRGSFALATASILSLGCMCGGSREPEFI